MKTFVLASLALAASLVTARAEETLIFATTNASNTGANTQVLHPWAARMNEQGAGVLKIDVRDGLTLANHINFYDRAINDVVQLTWGIQSQVAGKFVRSHVVTLPVDAGTEDTSVAYWRLYKTGLLDAEYDDIQPLMLVALSQSTLHTKRPLATLENLQGLKLAMNSKLVGDVIGRLGASQITIPLTDFYEALNRGAIDGAAIGWTAAETYKLNEVVTTHVDYGLGGTIGVVFMAKKRYLALSEAARKVIDANAGEKESRIFGAYWDRYADEVRQKVKADPKHKVITLDAAQAAKWRERVAPLVDEWVKATPDGAKVLSAWRDIVAKVKAGT
jgi:TRAP-type C4-dicarboxylate transport system substrate-binding protein